MNTAFNLLIQKYFDGALAPAELEQLNALLRDDPALLDQFIDQLDLHAGLGEMLQGDLPEAALAAATKPGRGKTSSRLNLRRVHRRPQRSFGGLVIGGLALAAAAVLAVLYSRGVFDRAPGVPQNRPEQLQIAHQDTPRPTDETARTATVLSVRGVAEGQPAGAATKQRLTGGESLAVGSTIQTAADAQVTLTYPDGSQLAVHADTTLVLNTAGTGKTLRLDTGSLAAEVKPQPTGAPMVLTTQYAQATVVGTYFHLANDNSGTGLQVRHGAVQFKRIADGATVMVRGDGHGQYAKAGPGIDLRVQLMAEDMVDGAIADPRAPGDYLLYDTFDSSDSWRNFNRLPATAANTIKIDNRRLVLEAANATTGWQNWYAVTTKAYDLEPLTLHTRLRIPAQQNNLVAGISLLDELDSGQGDRENIELLFRSDSVRLRRAIYPDAGSKDNPPKAIELSPDRTGLWQPAQWVDAALTLDGDRIKAQVNGQTVYDGPHGMQNWRRFRLALYTGLKDQAQTVATEFDHVIIERPIPQPTVTGFTLIDVDSGQPVPGYDPIPANATLDLAKLPAHLNIRANTSNIGTGCVNFQLDGVNYQAERKAPYSLAGSDDDVYKTWIPPRGRHTITATPFSGSPVLQLAPDGRKIGGATGTAGIAATLTFEILTNP